MSKKLRVFDFDDTLFQTSGKVIVKHENGDVDQLTAAQYAVYVEKPGDSFDFSQFVSVMNPVVIRPIAKRFYKIIKAEVQDRLTVILTARGKESVPHIKDILNKYFRVDVPVVATSSSDPQAKADWIRSKIENDGYNDIFFVDDSHKNVKAVYDTIRTLPVKYKIVDLSGPRKFEGDNTQVAKNLNEVNSGQILREFNGKTLENVKVYFSDNGTDVNMLELSFGGTYKSLVIESDYLDVSIV
jgi:hypothetical protein